jgi:hypothetical protein
MSLTYHQCHSEETRNNKKNIPNAAKQLCISDELLVGSLAISGGQPLSDDDLIFVFARHLPRGGDYSISNGTQQIFLRSIQQGGSKSNQWPCVQTKDRRTSLRIGHEDHTVVISSKWQPNYPARFLSTGSKPMFLHISADRHSVIRLTKGTFPTSEGLSGNQLDCFCFHWIKSIGIIERIAPGQALWKLWVLERTEGNSNWPISIKKIKKDWCQRLSTGSKEERQKQISKARS